MRESEISTPTNDDFQGQSPAVWGMLVALAVVWGSSYMLMKKGLVAFSPVEVAALRLTMSGFILLPFLRKALRNFPKKLTPWLFVVSWVGSGIPPFLFTFSILHTNSALNGIINSLTPVFTMLIGLLVFGNPVTTQKVAGIALGFLGCVCLVIFNTDGSIAVNAWALLAVLATICYGTSSNVLKSKLGHIHPVELTSLIYALACPPGILILATFTDFTDTVQTHPRAWEALGYIFLLSTLGSTLAIIVFNIVIQRTSALFASTVTYLMPIVAIFWGFLDGERLGVYHFAGMALILLGVFLMTRKKQYVKFGD